LQLCACVTLICDASICTIEATARAYCGIEVTRHATGETDPRPMNAIAYDAGCGTAPSVGNTITGGTSGATGVIVETLDCTGAGTLLMETRNGSFFSNNETLTVCPGCWTSTSKLDTANECLWFTWEVNATGTRSSQEVYDHLAAKMEEGSGICCTNTAAFNKAVQWGRGEQTQLLQATGAAGAISVSTSRISFCCIANATVPAACVSVPCNLFTEPCNVFFNGLIVRISNPCTFPTSCPVFSACIDYYVVCRTATTFKLAPNEGGTAKTISAAGTGTNTLNPTGDGEGVWFARKSGGSVGSFAADCGGTFTPPASACLVLTCLVNEPCDTDQTGTEVRIYTAGTQTELGGVENSACSFTFGYTVTPCFLVDVRVFNINYQPFTLKNLCLGPCGATIPVTQVIDRNFNDPD